MARSNLAICYEVVQRVYRNAIVRHIRTKLREKYPETNLEHLRKPFKKEEWEKINASALERRQTGELSAELLDEFDLLGVNHFFNIFDLHYNILADTDATEEGNKVQKQALLNWMKTIKSLRDPLSHPSEQDFSYEDSFFLSDCARRTLLRLKLPADAQKVKQLMAELSGRPGSILSELEPLGGRLPPRESIVVDFCGRKGELDQLRQWFLDPISRRWALAGEGGKGKTAVAFKFATDVKYSAPEPFHIVLWLSAKRRMFQEGTIVAIEEPDFTSLDTALDRILIEYGWTDETNRPVATKRKCVMELLDNFPGLVVVDDIDSLETEDEDAIEFFTLHVPQTKSKVLLTSRRTVFGMGNITTHVAGFDLQDAKEFILSRCRLLNLDPSLVQRHMPRIVEVAEGSPLYIEDLLRLVSLLPVEEALEVWRDKGGDDARRYALGRELDLLPKESREILVASCVSGRAISFAELEAVTGFNKDQITAALGHLQRLFLIPKPRLIEGEQRFDVNVNTRALVYKLLSSSEMYRRAETAYKAISGTMPQIGRGQVGAIIRQAVLYVRDGQQTQAESLLREALQRKYLNNSDLLGILGWVYKSWNPTRLTDARESFKRSNQLKCANEEMYKQWCRMEIEQREWTKAAEAADHGLQRIPKSRLLLYLAGYARSRLGKELLGAGHKEKAESNLYDAQVLLERALNSSNSSEIREQELTADIYRALVLNCEARMLKKEIRYYFERWREECPDNPATESEWTRIAAKFDF